MVPPAPATASDILTIHLFGAFSAAHNDAPLPRTRSRKEQWLLALLALRQGQPLDRDWLAGVFWPDTPQAGALGNLRRSLNDLRSVLGSDAFRLIAPTSRSVCLDLSGARVDVVEFDAAIQAGDAAALERALALYRGPLLEGCEEEWVCSERRERKEDCLEALEMLAALALARGEHSEAARLLYRAVSMDALRESAHRTLMEALSACGDYAAVDRHYRELRQALHREINSEPAEETAALYRLLRSRGRATSPSAPRTDAAPLRRLPCPLTRLVGRQNDVEIVAASLKRERLVTLTGSGGVGKTRLAIAVAEHIATEYPEGVWFVDLAPLTDAGLVAQAVASTLGVKEAPGRTLHQTLRDFLRSRTLLLLLDNCEHLLGACCSMAEALLGACRNLRILATSRERLNIAGEQAYCVPSLSLPDPSRLPAVDELSRCEAVRLFIERAESVHSTFAVTPTSAPALAQLCVRLDGIPLALELAAARVSALSVEEINGKLVEHFRLLTGGSRNALPRHQTLRALIDWSYVLLSDREKALLCRLSVFAGGWTLEAAEQVCTGEGIEAWEVLDLLTSLVDKSLVVPQQEDRTRYRMLATVRQYGQERLVERGEAETARERHQAFFLALAEEAEPQLVGPEQAAWLNRLEREHDNLRAALEWGNQEAALRISGALWRFWDIRGYLSEGRERLKAALAKAGARAHPSARAKALMGAGALTRSQSNLVSAQTLYQDCLALYQNSGDKQGIAYALNELGAVAHYKGDYATARALYEESLALQRALGNKRGIAHLLLDLGNVAVCQGDYLAAGMLCEESLATARGLGDKRGIATSLLGQGMIAYYQGDYAAARALHEESLGILRELGDKGGIARSLTELGAIAQSQGDYAAARTLYEESLALARESGSKRVIAQSLNSLGEVARDQGDYTTARRLLNEGLGIVREVGEKGGIAYALKTLGNILHHQGDHAAARTLFEESLLILRDMGDKGGIAASLNQLGAVSHSQGIDTEARALYEESLAIVRELGNRHGIASSLLGLGNIASYNGDNMVARSLYEESLALFRQLGDKERIATSLLGLGSIAFDQADYAAAHTLHQESLALFRQGGNKGGIASSLEAFAMLASGYPPGEEPSGRAPRLWGVAEALREEIGAPLSPPERFRYDRQVEQARAALSEEAFAAAWAEGRVMTMEEAIEYAIAEAGQGRCT